MTISEQRLNRREALLGVGLAGAGALALLSGCGSGSAAAANTVSGELEGAWQQEVTFDDGGQTLHALVIYTSGGGLVMVSTLPQAMFSAGLGAWARTSDNRYQITFEVLGFDASGQFAGLWRARALATIGATKDQMSALSSLEFQSAGGSTFNPKGTQHITGSRIKPQA